MLQKKRYIYACCRKIVIAIDFYAVNVAVKDGRISGEAFLCDFLEVALH